MVQTLFGRDLLDAFCQQFQVQSASEHFTAFNRKPQARQGLKLHVSAHLLNFQAVTEAVLPVLLEFQPSFKAVNSVDVLHRLNAGMLGENQAGKFLTIYPELDQFEALTVALDEATSHLASPIVTTDKQVRNSRVVFYRYAPFTRAGEVVLEGKTLLDTRDTVTPLPLGVEDPFAAFPRAYTPMIATYPDAVARFGDGRGWVVQSADGCTLWREGLSLGAVSPAGLDAQHQLDLEAENTLAHACSRVLRAQVICREPLRSVSCYKHPTPLMSLYEMLSSPMSMDLKRHLFDQVRGLLAELEAVGVYWGGFSFKTLWFDEQGHLFISHTETFTQQDLPAPELYTTLQFLPYDLITETRVDRLRTSSGWRLLKTFLNLFYAELLFHPDQGFYDQWQTMKRRVRAESAAGDLVPAFVDETLDRLHRSVGETSTHWEGVSRDTQPIVSPSDPPLALLNQVGDLGVGRSYYVIHLTTLVTQLEDVFVRAMQSLRVFKVPHVGVYVRCDSSKAFVEGFQGKVFERHDFGVLLSVFFEDERQFINALTLMVKLFADDSGPILPYARSTFVAPLVHYGRCQITAADTWVMEDPTDDETMRALEEVYPPSAEVQLPAHYEVLEAVSTRASGSVFCIRHTGQEDAQRLFLKEARVGYEPSATGVDAAMRCKREGEVLRSLQDFGWGWIPRWVDAWQTSFATMLVTDWVDGVPLDEAFEQADLTTRCRLVETLYAQLRTLHQAGWVWLDLKPSNIRVGTTGAVTFLDFETAVNTLTETREILWETRRYSFPEAIETFKTPQQLRRLDDYALVITCLELVGALVLDEETEAFTPNPTIATLPEVQAAVALAEAIRQQASVEDAHLVACLRALVTCTG